MGAEIKCEKFICWSLVQAWEWLIHFPFLGFIALLILLVLVGLILLPIVTFLHGFFSELR